MSIDKKGPYIYHMYNVFDISRVQGFNWDKGNLDKSYKKHGVTANEAEEIFLDRNFGYEKDIKHSQSEKRYIGIGKTDGGMVLFAVFSIRKNSVRIVSVRKANKKERAKYESEDKQ